VVGGGGGGGGAVVGGAVVGGAVVGGAVVAGAVVVGRSVVVVVGRSVVVVVGRSVVLGAVALSSRISASWGSAIAPSTPNAKIAAIVGATIRAQRGQPRKAPQSRLKESFIVVLLSASCWFRRLASRHGGGEVGQPHPPASEHTQDAERAPPEYRDLGPSRGP
jgi:hypothetical protein